MNIFFLENEHAQSTSDHVSFPLQTNLFLKYFLPLVCKKLLLALGDPVSLPYQWAQGATTFKIMTAAKVLHWYREPNSTGTFKLPSSYHHANTLR